MNLDKQIAIAREYNLPFSQVVKQFADAGESIGATAEILGYSSGAFRRLIHRRGWRDWFKGPTETNGFVAARAARRGISQDTSHMMANNPVYRWFVVNGIRDTLTGHARRVGISRHTVRNRLAVGLSIEEALKPVSRVRPPKNNSKHAWREKKHE